MHATIKTSGFRDIEAALHDLANDTSSATAKNAMRRALVDAGEPMAERARQLVAEDTQELKNSITVSTKIKDPSKAVYAQILGSGGSRADALAGLRTARRVAKGGAAVVAFVGPSGDVASRAHLVEFGAKPHVIARKDNGKLSWPDEAGRVTAKSVAHPGSPPQPFMRPAFEETREQVVDRLKPALIDQIDKAAKRAARRKAKRGR